MSSNIEKKINKFYIGENNIVSSVAIRTQLRKGYVKPLFIKNSIPTIIRAWSYNDNMVILA